MNDRACLFAGRLCLLIVSFSVPVFADTLTGDHETNHTVITARMMKGLDVDGWSVGWNRDEVSSAGSRSSLQQSLDVRLFRRPGYQRQWKVDHSLEYQFDHPLSLSSGLALKITQGEHRDQSTRRYAQSDVSGVTIPLSPRFEGLSALSGDRTRDRISTTFIGAGGRIITENGIELEGLAGPVFDFRGGVAQEGINYIANYRFAIDSLKWAGSGKFSHFGSGDEHNVTMNVVGTYFLSSAASNSLQASYFTGSRREFTPFDSRLGKRNDRRLQVDNELKIQFSEELDGFWTSAFMNRHSGSENSSSSRSDREFDWNNSFTGKWAASGRYLEVNGGVEFQQQEYAGGLTQGRNTRLQTSAGIAGESTDTTLIEAGVSRYRFDTPDELDHNDRDELRWRFHIRSGRHLTSALMLRAGLDVNLNHLVYLHRTRSGENRWTRQFTLYSEVPWRDYPVENNARFAAAAHYTDYDFTPFDLTNSRVFRTFTAVDTLRLAFDRNWRLEVNALGQLDDYGAMNWSEWQQNISEEGSSYTIVFIPVRKHRRTETGLGWVLNRRLSYAVKDNGDRETSEDIRSYGPVARFLFYPNGRFNIAFHSTILTIKRAGGDRLIVPDVNLEMNLSL